MCYLISCLSIGYVKKEVTLLITREKKKKMKILDELDLAERVGGERH